MPLMLHCSLMYWSALCVVAFYRQVIDFCNQYGKETGILRAWLGFHLVTLVCTAETAEVSIDFIASLRNLSKLNCFYEEPKQLWGCFVGLEYCLMIGGILEKFNSAEL
jgi:hypothetical protein